MGIKIVILILVIVGVAFFVMLGFGADTNNTTNPPPKDNEGRMKFVRAYPPPEWIGSLLGSFSSKLTLAQRTISFGGTRLEIEVPESDKRFRQATFLITEGCGADCANVVIHYDSQHPDAGSLGLTSQTWQPGTRNPREGSLIIFQDRGPVRPHIVFDCTGTLRCVAELQ